MQMRVADLIRDAGLLPQIQEMAQQLLQEHPDAVAGIMHRWIGAAGEYGNV
jgi:ATP-dependent DNA helicase RecG